MNITNYLHNYQPTKVQKQGEIVPKEDWIGEKQDIWYFKVFGSAVSVVIPKEKRQKSDIFKS